MKKLNMADMLVVGLIIAVGIFANLPVAHAITAPATGSFAYTVYDVGVNDILKGPIGFVGGAAAIVYGAVRAIQGNIMASAPAILGGAVLLKADSVVSSLGAIV